MVDKKFTMTIASGKIKPDGVELVMDNAAMDIFDNQSSITNITFQEQKVNLSS